MKAVITRKLLAAVVSILVMSLACALLFYPEDFIGMFVFGSIMFFVLYLVGGIPLSAVITRYLGLTKNALRNSQYVVSHMVGGLIVTILLMVLTEPEHGIDMYVSREMFDFYWIGIMSGFVFSLIEIVIYRLQRNVG